MVALFSEENYLSEFCVCSTTHMAFCKGILVLLALTALPTMTAFTLPALAPARGRVAARCTGPAASLEVINTSYDLAIGSVLLGGVFGLPSRAPSLASRAGYALGALCAVFGLFIAFQTTTLRFTFDETSFALVKADGSSTGENVVVGGENVWRYDEFVNWDFFPSESFPILVYFKETQTPEQFWNVGPGEQANSPEALARGAKPGQVHFFPAIARVDELKASFKTHACAKL